MVKRPVKQYVLTERESMGRLRNNYSTLLFIISATMLGKILGMVRDMMLAYYYGTGSEAVAFITASRLPLNFFDFALGAVIGSAFIPTFNEVLKLKGRDYGLRFANEFVNVILYIAMILATLGMGLAPFLVRLVAGGLTGETYELTVQLTRVMFPMLIFTAVAFAFVGILQSFGEFNVPAAISIISNLVMIVYFVTMNQRFGVEGLAVAMVIGWACQMLVQVPFLVKRGFRYSPVIRFTASELRSVAVIMGPILISTWVQPINVFVNTYLASHIEDGTAVAVLEYANKVYIIIAGVFVLAVTNLVFPSLARFLAADDMDHFSQLLSNALRMVIFFMIPVSVGVILFSEPIVRILYQRGATDASQGTQIAGALIFYTLGIVFYGFREILSKAYYAYGDSRTPMNIAIVGIAFNITLSIILVRTMGLNGLALAASLAALLMAFMMAWDFNRQKHRIIHGSDLIYTVKALVMALIMGVAVWASNEWMLRRLGEESLIMVIVSMTVSTVLGVVIYFAGARLVRLSMPKLVIDDGNGEVKA